MLDMNEVNKLDAKALEKKEAELRKELFELRFQKKMATLEKPHRLREVRRDVARLLTVKNNKG